MILASGAAQDQVCALVSTVVSGGAVHPGAALADEGPQLVRAQARGLAEFDPAAAARAVETISGRRLQGRRRAQRTRRLGNLRDLHLPVHREVRQAVSEGVFLAIIVLDLSFVE